jgi:hypothetical protein
MPIRGPVPMPIDREDTSGGTVKDKSFDPGTIAKTIVDEASRLKNDAAEWGQKLQELEADLKNNENVDGTVKDVDESLVVVRAAADRLAPNSETRATLRKQEDAIRDLAIRAEVHLGNSQDCRLFSTEDRRAARCQPILGRNTDPVGHGDRSVAGAEGSARIQSCGCSEPRSAEGGRG